VVRLHQPTAGAAVTGWVRAAAGRLDDGDVGSSERVRTHHTGKNDRQTAETTADAVLRELRAASAAAPTGELSQFGSRLTARQYRVPWALTAALVRPPSDVLDWGCGDGHFSYFLLRSGHRVTSYSLQHPPFVLSCLSRELRERSRYVQGRPDEPTRLPFEDESFDAVASVGVLEHVRETGGTEAGSLREIRRVLRPQGRFLCFHLPNRYSAVEWGARFVGRGHHVYRYSSGEIRALIEDAGLRIEASSAYAFLPRNSWRGLPPALGDSAFAARIVDAADDGLTRIGAAVCQNRFVIAMRP
jgi:SAM-dependent methyltransferase